MHIYKKLLKYSHNHIKFILALWNIPDYLLKGMERNDPVIQYILANEAILSKILQRVIDRENKLHEYVIKNIKTGLIPCVRYQRMTYSKWFKLTNSIPEDIQQRGAYNDVVTFSPNKPICYMFRKIAGEYQLISKW